MLKQKLPPETSCAEMLTIAFFAVAVALFLVLLSKEFIYTILITTLIVILVMVIWEIIRGLWGS